MADLNSTIVRGKLRVTDEAEATNIKENGTNLSDKYLGKTAKAADSDKLNGQSASYYATASSLGTAASKDVGTSSGNVPILDSNGKLNTSVLPAIAVSEAFTAASESAMLALTAQVGDVCVRTDLTKTYILVNTPASTLANWKVLEHPADAVSSVNGKTGTVTLTASDVGAAESGHTHSSYVNQNAFSNVKVGSTTVVADSATDTLELVGSNVTLTPDATNDKVTIGITGQNVKDALGYTPGTSNLALGSTSSTAATGDHTHTVFNNKLSVNPTDGSSFNEGVRINRANNNWANVVVGGDNGSTSGTGTGIWLVGRRGQAGSKSGGAGDFTIEHNGSTGTGLTLYADGSKPRWNNNPLAYSSEIPTTLPASDVYDWAKASTKPSYSFSEITSRGEEYLEWGGPSKTGSVSPIGMAVSNEHNANRLTFINGNALTFEYSSDGGTTWTDYGFSAGSKSEFCTSYLSVPIGRASGSTSITTNSKTRITLTAQNGTTGYIYTSCKKILVEVSTATNLEMLIEYKTGRAYQNNGSWVTFGTYMLGGWSGWNDIPLILTVGGGSTQIDQPWQVRFTISVKTVNSQYPTTAYIQRLRMYGDNIWTSPSTMATTGHLYSYNTSQNATFPAGVSATSFTENGTALSSKYLSSHQSIKSINTNNTTAQTANASEAVAGTGTINLHKVSKTGSYNDLNNKPDTFIDITDGVNETIKNKIMANKAIILKYGYYYYVPQYQSDDDYPPSYYNCFEGDSENFKWLHIDWANYSIDEDEKSYAVSDDIGNGTLTIQKNGTSVATFTANSSSNVTANINVPTTLDDISDGSTRKLSNYLEKTTYEYNKEISFGASGYLLIGKFPMYDSNVTIEVNSTTNNTYHGVLVLATQNINESRGGTWKATVYGDSTGSVSSAFKIKYSSGSRNFEIYFQPTAWSKNLVHIQANALRSAPTNICESVNSIPATDLIDINNSLIDNFLGISATASDSSKLNNQEASYYLNYNNLTNKPTLGTAAAKDYSTSVTQNDANLVTSGAVYTAIANLPTPMQFKGTLGTGGTITSLPAASSSNNGYTYKVITAGTYASTSAKVGDVFVSNGSSWVLIPSGDVDTDTDTWRNIKVNGTEKLGTGISSGAVNFKDGSNVTITGDASGNITIAATDTTYNIASSSTLGLVKSTTTGTTTNRNYYVEVIQSGTDAGKMKVNVPWENTTYTIPTSLKNPNKLNLKVNSESSNFVEYDGSAAKTLTVAPSTTAGAFTISDGTTTKTIQLAGTFTDNNTATAADNILDGSNSGTQITYAPYSSQQSKLSFDTSSTNPTRTDRLNLNGKLYATKLYSGGNEVADTALTTTEITNIFNS